VANFDPTSAAANWVAALSQAGAKATAGAQRVQTAPGAAAAQQAQKFINGVTAAVTSGKWQRKVSAVTLADWQNAYITKGVPRIASGAQASQAKFASALTNLFPFMQNLHGQISNMPSDTPAARDARMLAWAQGMRQYKG
jgi:hypothetical protein